MNLNSALPKCSLSTIINNHKVQLNTLIDSGCSFPLVISEKMLPKNTPIDKNGSKTFTVANGNTERTLGTTNITILHNEELVIKAIAHVMRKIPEDLIIGFPVICKLKLKLCNEYMEAELNSKSVKIQ